MVVGAGEGGQRRLVVRELQRKQDGDLRLLVGVSREHQGGHAGVGGELGLFDGVLDVVDRDGREHGDGRIGGGAVGADGAVGVAEAEHVGVRRGGALGGHDGRVDRAGGRERELRGGSGHAARELRHDGGPVFGPCARAANRSVNNKDGVGLQAGLRVGYG